MRQYVPIIPLKNADGEISGQVSHSLSIAQAMNSCLWLGDKDHRTIYVNPVYERLSGYSLQECIGQPADFCFDEESKRIIANQHKLRGKGVSSQYEATMVSKAGKRIPLLVSGAPTVTGGTIGIFIDLTKVKQLEHHETIWKQIIKHTSEAFVILNNKRRIKLWNSGASKTFGYKEEEVIDRSIDILIPEELREANTQLIKEVERKGSIKNVETKRLHKNGDLIDVSVSVTKVINDKKHFIGFLIVYRDITSEKKVNSELQKRFEAIQDAYKELGLQTRHLDYIYEILDATVSNSSLESLEKLIVSAMCLLTKADGAILRLNDNKRGILKLKACFGVSGKWWDKSQIQLENSLAQEAFENQRALIVDNIDTHPKHQGKKLLKSHKYKTLILLPLFMNGKNLGSLSLYAKNPGDFRLIETEFLEYMGKQCSMAIFSKMRASLA